MLEDQQLTILVIDDDNFTLKVVNKHLLTELNLRFNILCAQSGSSGLELLEHNNVNLVLLDVIMPEIDGMEVLRQIRAQDKYKNLPVIMMSADMFPELEAEAFRLGATDFIHKPFTAEVISLRIERHLRLAYLQDHLEKEVKNQTILADNRLKANYRIFQQIVLALAKTIDAKDPYTRGHSVRVAKYSRSLSKLSGDSPEEQDQIYYMGLLHDIGKIGIPMGVINKPDKLTDDEYEIIKQHTLIGDEILSYIEEFPQLRIGARYHHERYDGTGYPDGLKGKDIPRQARIIGVADAYDTMTSKRKYRDILPQNVVREQLEKGMNTQFDPVFARLMLKMMDLDHEYRLRQQEDDENNT